VKSVVSYPSAAPFLIVLVLELVLVLDAFSAEANAVARAFVHRFPVQAVFNQQRSKIEFEDEFEER
jgi:hypothetical protein